MITLKETTERYNLGQNKKIQNADQEPWAYQYYMYF